MSATKRFLSGSAASWAKIGINIISQVALVPIFLSHWSIEQYGCWLVIASISGLASIFSTAHQCYLEYEFLKIGDKNPQSLALMFYSSIPFAIFFCLFELVFICIGIWLGLFNNAFDAKHTLSPALLNEAFWSLIITSVTWLLVTSVGGLGGRLVSPLGYFPRFAWWGVTLALLTTIASVTALYSGAGLLTTTITVSIVNCLVNIPIHLDIWRLSNKHQIFPVKPDWHLGASVTLRSFALVVGSVIDNLRNQGIRVFLSSIVGLSQMTTFSTTRTISNVSLQGIGTVSNPAMPELMRFLRERDEVRMHSIMGFLLFMTVILLAPAMLLLQLLIPDIFLLWTRGKVPYDETLFAIFSIGLMFNAYARSASAIIQGNNLVKVQLTMSVTLGFVAVGGIVLLSTFYGIHGAAAALLLAEMVGDGMAIFYATKWLRKNEMHLPLGLFVLSLTSIFIASTGILFMVRMPNLKFTIFFITIVFCLVNSYFFVMKLPSIVLKKLTTLVRKMSY
jgi:O-antigen/teichoic acid export membrane protein